MQNNGKIKIAIHQQDIMHEHIIFLLELLLLNQWIIIIIILNLAN